MRVAIALLRYFPHGGLQRDALLTAEACRAAGHEVTLYVRRWDGPSPEGIPVRRLHAGGWTNHDRARRFGAALGEALARAPVDVTLGFDRLPGLDAWFAADPCYLERLAREKGRLHALTPRARTWAALEHAVAGVDARARILLVDPRQRALFRAHHGTPEARFVELPPGVAPDRRAGPDAAALRASGRSALDVGEDERLLLLLGSDFRRKGLDRALAALAALPPERRARTRLVAVGADAAAPWQRRARRAGLGDRVRVEGGRDDVPRLLQAADLLLHPARTENTGTVLVEALAAGLPVLCTGACGYAAHVESAGAGTVLPEPFEQAALNAALGALLAKDRRTLRDRALAWAARTDLDGLHRRIVRELEIIAGERT